MVVKVFHCDGFACSYFGVERKQIHGLFVSVRDKRHQVGQDEAVFRVCVHGSFAARAAEDSTLLAPFRNRLGSLFSRGLYGQTFFVGW